MCENGDWVFYNTNLNNKFYSPDPMMKSLYSLASKLESKFLMEVLYNYEQNRPLLFGAKLSPTVEETLLIFD